MLQLIKKNEKFVAVCVQLFQGNVNVSLFSLKDLYREPLTVQELFAFNQKTIIRLYQDFEHRQTEKLLQ